EPWLHYLIRIGQPGTETFCSGVSYTGGGFDVRGTHENTFIDTQLHLNDSDTIGRTIYVVDHETGTLFSTMWQPVRNPDQQFETTLDFGSMIFRSRCKEIETEVVMFVPQQFDGWIQNVTIQNSAAKPRHLSLYPFVPIHMGNSLVRLVAGDNDAFFGGAAWDKECNALVFRRHHGIPVNDDREKINGMLGNVAAFYSTLNTPQTTYETSMERFLGNRFHSLAQPAALILPQLSCKDQAHLRRTCGIFKNDITLAPGQSLTFAVALVACSTQDYYLNEKKMLRRQLSILQNSDQRLEMLQQVKAWWRNLQQRLLVQSPEPSLNRAFPWLQYQCEIVYVLNRMKSRYHTGYEYGWGFRDILQDVLYKLPYDTDAVASALRHIATQMFSTGICYHNFFIDQPGNKSIEASDDPLWFPNAVIRYCKESGAFSLLDEVVDYAEVREGTPGVYGSIMEHCLKAIDRVWIDKSHRNLPFMKDCDWNDDLNELRREGKPNIHMESVMVGQQLYRCLLDMVDLFKASHQHEHLIEEYERRAQTILEALQTYAFDKEGYCKRALSVDGNPTKDLGTSDAATGKIFLETQVFAILSGIADSRQSKRILDSVKKYLDTEFGAMICFPLYTDLSSKGILPSRSWNIEKEPPAMKENGSIFMHLNAWLIQAYAATGRGTDAVNCYLKTMPENLASDQDRYKSEPYIYPEYVRGKGGEEFGRGGHTWLTGTAPTMHQALIECIFGVKAEYGGLLINPCVHPQWKEFSLIRHFRNATYEIHFKNPQGIEQGVSSITVDGVSTESSTIPSLSDGKKHVVIVHMGT
ncbi:MAG: hypothetical protein JW795_06375, partial [Chitinivibrionales bacterium]|nr:hypothetical protein [Chitinivibrionales bacterium]